MKWDTYLDMVHKLKARHTVHACPTCGYRPVIIDNDHGHYDCEFDLVLIVCACDDAGLMKDWVDLESPRMFSRKAAREHANAAICELIARWHGLPMFTHLHEQAELESLIAPTQNKNKTGGRL